MFEELRTKLGIQMDLDLMIRVAGLIFARMLGACMQIPFLGGQMIPNQLKTGIPLIFTAFLYPIISASVNPAHVPAFGIAFFILALKEVFVGYCIGHICALPFYAVQMAGSFMDTQRGTTFAQVIAPLMGGQTSLLSQFYLLLFITIFLGLGGSHLVIGAIGESYRVLPILNWPKVLDPSAPFVNEAIDLTGAIFTLALQISAPVVIAMLLTDATLGIVNRTAPNVQVFWLGMPIKTLGGLVIVFFAIGYASDIFAQLTVGMAATLKRTIVLLAGGGAG
ncbi:MAG TPA: flagellar biosynthetic protein FliR [Planctomycetota bacterium]|nr:flagellar biosynthetic protein FliR [Planctomycetota bacterium]